MQRLFEQSGYFFLKIKGAGPTSYVGICKSYLSNQSMFSKKAEALDLQAMMEKLFG
jgi:hypothetical protein